jgi:hypothetical protein
MANHIPHQLMQTFQRYINASPNNTIPPTPQSVNQ